MYRKGASNRDIYNQLKDLQGYFIADSAEPKSIAELRSYGMSVLDAEKGQGSVLHGIQSLQSIDLKVTSSSLNLIKELRNYTWMKDKSGAVLNQPIDAYNHCIDALRYVGQKHILKKGSGKYRIR
jgi:phage terminase large subunit